MSGKDLKEKAIKFKGKEYVEVHQRIIFFNKEYPNGCIQTVDLSTPERERFKAIVWPDIDKPARFFTGTSQASFNDTTSFVNKTSATENAETSAVGRALAMMGIGVIDGIASIDEINKSNSSHVEISGGGKATTTKPINVPVNRKQVKGAPVSVDRTGEEFIYTKGTGKSGKPYTAFYDKKTDVMHWSSTPKFKTIVLDLAAQGTELSYLNSLFNK